MLKTLDFTDISQEKFNTIMIGMLEIIKNKAEFESFLKLENMEDAFEFLQVFSPGNYSKEDFAKFLMIIMANIYFHSKKYARHELFELTLADIKKRTGTDFKKYLQNFRKLREKQISDNDFNVSGGIGDKKLSKIIAGSLAALVPFSAVNSSGSSAQAIYRSQAMNRKKAEQSSGGFWNWCKENWKAITIGASVVATGIGAFVTYKRIQSSKKYVDEANEMNKKKDKDKAELSTSLWDYFRPGSSARDKLEEERYIREEENKRDKEIADITALVRKLDNKEAKGEGKIGASADKDKIIKFMKNHDIDASSVENADDKTVNDYLALLKVDKMSKIEKPNDLSKKKMHEEIVKESDKVGITSTIPALGAIATGGMALINFGKSIFEWFSNLADKAGKIAELPKKVIEAQEKINDFIARVRWDDVPRYYDDESKLLMASNIEEGLNNIIKGQKAQMKQLASILATFNMQARMAYNRGEDSSGVLGSSQLNSKCVFLTGPSGTGKSMLTSLAGQFALSRIRCLAINLNQYDGKTDVNTYLSNQKEFINAARGLEGEFVVITIEEIDKICKDPVIREKVNHWLHSVYDTGKIGGNDKETPVTVAATLFLMTSNELPSIDVLINGKVSGLNIKSGNQVITSSNKYNYIDILKELSKNSSRELPIERTGALLSRSAVIEFNQTSDDAMKEIIDMHLQELNQQFWICGVPVKVNYSDVFVEKLARLRHAKMYKDGGSRTIIKDILNPIFSNITDKIGKLTENLGDVEIYDQFGNVIEENLAQVWLDYGGINDSGALVIDLKENEKDAKCDGREPDMYEEELNTSRKPEVEKFIQKLMLDELSNVIGSLSTAYNSGVVEDWDATLNQGSKNVIKRLSSLVSSNVEKSSLDEQIKVLIEKRNDLIDLMHKRGILDDEWESLKDLRDVVKAKTADAIAIKRNNEKSKISLDYLQETINNIEKIRDLAVSVKQYDLFSANNKNSLGKIFEIFSDNGIDDFENNSLKLSDKLDNLISNKDIINSLKPDLTEEQHNAIEKFRDSVQNQIEAVRLEVQNRANEVDAIFDDIIKLKNNTKIDYKLVLSQTDSNFLKSLIALVNSQASVSDIGEQLNFVLGNKSQIKNKLLQVGVADEQLGDAKSLKFKIQQASEVNKKKDEKQETKSEEKIKKEIKKEDIKENDRAEISEKVSEIFDDINLDSIPDSVDCKSILSKSDIEFLRSLISMIDPEMSISDANQQLNFVLANKAQIKEKLIQNGVTDEQLESANALKFKISQILNRDISQNDNDDDDNNNMPPRIKIEDNREEIDGVR